MDRNREARRASIVGSNGFNRRRHRTNSLRDSPDEEGGMELQESVRLRDRVKKDRERERVRERERERERSSRSKRRIGERLTSNREDIGGGDTSEEESLNDDEYDEDEETTSSGGARFLNQSVGSVPNHHHHHSHSSSFTQQHNSNSNSTSNTVSSNHLQHRKSFHTNPSSAKVSRAPPVWKSGDEMISVSVPRKARSASTKRSHDWSSMSSGGGAPGLEHNPGPASNSSARQGVVPMSRPTPPAPVTPTSPNASMRKKPKPTFNTSGTKLKPPKVAAKPSSSNTEELEIEIAEVLYGLLTQSQAPSSNKEDSREINRLSSDAKSRNSSPISNSPSAVGSTAPLPVVAPKKKRPRQIHSSYGARSSSIHAKPDIDQKPKVEISSVIAEKSPGSAAENGFKMSANPVNPHAPPADPPARTDPNSAKMDSERKTAPEELREGIVSVAKEEVILPNEEDSPAVRAAAAAATKANSTSADTENRKEEKFEIDLMAPPPQARPSPEREAKTDLRDSPVDQKPVVSITDANVKPALKDQSKENGNCGRDGDHSSNFPAEEKKVKGSGEEVGKKDRNVDLHIDLRKSERDGGDGFNATRNKSLLLIQKQQQQQLPLSEKSGHSTRSLPLTTSMASWPSGLPPMGYMAPLQGVVSMEGGAVAPAHIPPVFTQPRPKRCATHCHIARNIHYLQQFTKMNPFWPPPAASASLFGSKNAMKENNQNVANIPNHAMKEKSSQPASNTDSAQRKKQILIQQALPPVGPSNLLGPTFIFPLNQQQSAAPQPSGAKSPATGVVSSNASSSAVTSSNSTAAVRFNYPPNEMQYLAILQNNGYSFPIPASVGAAPNYRGPLAQAMPLFSGSFYSPQMIHPSQLQPPQQPHQNASTSSSSSQKHLQTQQQKMRQSRVRHHEGEVGAENSPSRTDNRASVNIYGQNFAMPTGLMTHPGASVNTTHAEKKQGSKIEPAHSSFAMSFGAMTGSCDISSMAEKYALFQNSLDAMQQSIEKNDDGTSGGVDSSGTGEKSSTGGGGRSIAFTRSDLGEAHAASRTSRSMSTNNMGQMNLQNAHSIQAQLQQQHMMQLKQQQQQQQMVANSSRNGDLNPSSTMASKFPSGFPQNLLQSNTSSPSQSPQWKASARTSTPQTSSSTTILKHPPQHHSRTQISFGGNQKPLAAASNGQLHPNNNQTSIVGSPTTSSASKGAASGSPKTSSASTNKSEQLSKNLPSPSILGNPQIQQQSQQQKLFFSNPYAQSQSPHLAGKNPTTSGAGGFYMARRQKEQHQQSSGMNTNDPATAIAAATANGKAGGLFHTSPFPAGNMLPAGFSYAHPIQVKPAEQKQPAGNDNLHPWQSEKK